jgi:hypothetical protein
MLGVLAVVGTIIVSPVLNRPATPQKSTVVAPKANPVPKTSVPAQRTQPLPRPRPPTAIVRPERKAVKKQTAAPKQKRGPTASQCADLRDGIDRHGITIVRAGARLRGYSTEDFNWAHQRCGL